MPQKKGVIALKYEKPEVIHTVSALAAVQGNTKSDLIHTELLSMEPKRTVPAYEADE